MNQDAEVEKSIFSVVSVQFSTSKPSEEVSSEYSSPNVILSVKRFPATKAFVNGLLKCFSCPFFKVRRMVNGGLSAEGNTITVELADIDRLSADIDRGNSIVFVKSLGSAV